MHVAQHNLDGRHNGRHPHRHRKHDARARVGFVFKQMPSAHATDQKSRGQVSRRQGVHQPVAKAGVEDDGQPAAGRDELTVGVDRVACRRLHPAVDRQDPEGRHEGAQRHHQRGREVQARAHAVHAKQHDAQKSGLQKKRRQHLVGHQRPDDRPGLVRKHRPVGAELVRHDNARDHAHGEHQCKDLDPVTKQVHVLGAAGFQPQAFEHRQVTGQPDGDGRK